jgi:hypothetical protein
MGYIEDLEKELEEKLDNGMEREELIKFLKDKVLESYRNGLKAQKQSKPKSRHSETQETRQS